MPDQAAQHTRFGNCWAAPYVVLHVSIMRGTGSQLKRAVGDLSYGTYLFGFPVTLSVIAMGGELGIYATFAISVSLSLIFAWLSWHIVEQPCLRLKSKFHVRKISRRTGA